MSFQLVVARVRLISLAFTFIDVVASYNYPPILRPNLYRSLFRYADICLGDDMMGILIILTPRPVAPFLQRPIS